MAGTSIKGSIELAIDLQGLEARLNFTPDKDGDEWNAESVLKLCGDRRISPLPSARAVDELLQKIGKSKETVSSVIVKGTAPELPIGERITWADLPIPDDLVEIVKRTSEKAAPPELYRIRVDKVKKETLVKKPGALPFLPGKEETVVSWEKTETRERFFANPEVEDIAYILKGMKAGIATPPKPGRPGKSVYGKPVPPPPQTEGGFLLGNGLEREKNELRATISGILRIGDSWADILPLAKPSWKVQIGADGLTIFLYYECGDKRLERPSAEDILKAALELGVKSESLIDAEDLASALDTASQNEENLEAFPLSRKQDAEARVDISSDALKASLYLRKGIAGAAPLELRAVSEAIKASAVRGFKAEQVKNDILAFFKGPSTELKDYLLVEGKAATRGKDRELKHLVAYLPEASRKELCARIDADPRLALSSEEDTFPAAQAMEAAYVEKDIHVAQLTQAPPGNPGVDVLGRTLPAILGNDPEIKLLSGLNMRGNNIVAEVSGILLVQLGENAYTARIAQYRDAVIEVNLSPDAMSASVTLEKEIGGGKPLNAENLNAALAEAGVIRGIDQTALSETLLYALSAGRIEDAVIARGEKPVAGGGSAIRWLVQKAAGKGVTIREDGRADYKNQDRFHSVTEGTALAEIIKQGAEGRAGFDVLGKILGAEKGESISIEHDDSVLEEKIENGIRYVAARTGELQYDEKSIRINALYSVKGDIGVATGNVNFPGEVRVSGKVNPGFAVIGSADVLIGESADASLVSSGGKVVIGQGIIGGGKGVVRARAGIDASFVEQATLLAVDDIRVKNGCMQSQVKTNGKLRLLGEKGHLIGGLCRARLGVEAANIGSERGTRTEISFGQDYLVMDQIEVSERESEKIKKALVDLEARIKRMQAQGQNLEAAHTEKLRIMKLLEKHGMRLFTLREKFEEHHLSEIRVRGSVFPGVVMESHGRYYEVKQKKSQVVFVFDRELGRIQEKPLK